MNNSTAVEELTFSEVASNGSVTWIATKIVAVCLLILATLTGNVLVILAIYKTPSLRSSATNMFVGGYISFLYPSQEFGSDFYDVIIIVVQLNTSSKPVVLS